MLMVFLVLLALYYTHSKEHRYLYHVENSLLQKQRNRKAHCTSFSLNMGIWTSTLGWFLLFSRSSFTASRLYLVDRFFPKHLTNPITIAMYTRSMKSIIDIPMHTYKASCRIGTIIGTLIRSHKWLRLLLVSSYNLTSGSRKAGFLIFSGYNCGVETMESLI